MDKRYQVFVSSTFTDLQDERSRIIRTLMELDCIPAGMELFPAADEDQLAFIKKVIDDCDYYLLVIGGRYGSLSPEGVSYTEQEYDYAVSKGLYVLGFLHGKPDDLAVTKSELDPNAREKLKRFRDKVAAAGRLVKFWDSPEHLEALVTKSLARALKVHPAIGWVRATTVGNAELLAENNQLRRENETIKTRLADQIQSVPLPNLATLNEQITVTGDLSSATAPKANWKADVTWQDVFDAVAPLFTDGGGHWESAVRGRMAGQLAEKRINPRKYERDATLDTDVFDTIRIQLIALRLFDVRREGSHTAWSMTEKGKRLLFETRAVRSVQSG